MNESLLNLPEITPVFKNCRVVGSNTPQGNYRYQKCKRGEPGYVMGQGSIQRFNRCPLKWLKTEEIEDSDAMRIGSAVDCRLLTPQYEDTLMAVQPAEYVNEKKETKPWHNGATVCKQWQADNANKLVLSQKENEQVNSILESLKNDPSYQIIRNSMKQVMVEGLIVIEDISIPVRALIDIMPHAEGEYHDYIVDLKVTNSLAIKDWKRHVYAFGLFVQAAFYCDIYSAATGENRTTFSNIAVEDTPPYIVEHRIYSQNFLRLGRIRYLDAFTRYAKCIQTQQWPSYDEERPLILDVEPWMLSLT